MQMTSKMTTKNICTFHFGTVLYYSATVVLYLIDLLNLSSSLNKKKKKLRHRDSVAGSVIQATRTVEFEDGLKTEVLPGG